MLHGQFNMFNYSVQTSKLTRNHLNKLTSLYDLSLFNFDSNLDVNINPLVNLSNLQIRSRYFSPHSFVQTISKFPHNVLLSSFSIFHNNVVSLNGNLENLQTHILEELEFHFDVLRISETKITNSNVEISTPLISGYNFEFVPTPLASGGVALFIDEKHNYRVLEKTSNTVFQALWIEIYLVKKKNVICGIIYRQHNSPECFLQHFDESIEKYTALDKEICILGDFNIDLLKVEISNYSQDFIMSLQSCYLIPTVVKPSTRVRSTSATLIDNIFVNTPEKVLVSGNFISDISDHFSQFCILTSIVTQTKAESRKVRDFSKFSPDSFTADISQVDWSEILERDNVDVDRAFSFFYNKFNKILNKHAPFKILSKRRIQQLSKPCITRGIRTAIKIKNNLYMSGNHARYKYYRNEISKLTRISKKLYYHDFF